MAKQDVMVELNYDGAWNDITFQEDVYTRDPIEVTRGRADEASATPPANASMTLENNDGTYNPRNPDSPLFGIGRNLPARITVGSDVRFAGEISSWTPRRAIKGDAWTEVRASGPLRRLSQGTPPVRSAARRTGATAATGGYWPLEGERTSSALPALDGGTIAIAPSKGVTFGDQDGPPGSEKLATFGPAAANVSGSGTATPSVGTLSARIPDGLSATSWRMSFVARAIAADSPLGSLMWQPLRVIMSDGNSIDTLIYCSFSGGAYGATCGMDVVGRASTFTFDPAFNPWADQQWHSYTAELTQDGADIETLLYVDGVLWHTAALAGTLAAPVAWRGASLGDGTVDGVADNNIGSSMSIGHVMFGDSTHGLSATEYHAAVFGHPGETAGNRFLRLCDEEGITAAIVGDEDDTPEMGPQLPDSLPNLLREVEATDDGFIYDTRDEIGLTMRTGRSCYNQDPVLALNYDAYEIAPPTDPVVDDMNTRNDVTASRRGGSSARAVLESGPLNVSDPSDDPEGVGRYTHQVDVQPFSDLVLGDYAQWHLHRGTVDETRWPTVTVDLDATPDVDVSSVEIGDRLTISNMPADVTPDDVSLIVLGWTETVGSHRRRITFTCAPESPLHIAEVEHDDYSVIGSSATYRRSSVITTTQTSITFTIEEGPDWSFESAFDIVVNGERMTVTGIAAGSGTYPSRTQVFTVVRSINGIVKSHPIGSRVELFHKSYIGL